MEAAKSVSHAASTAPTRAPGKAKRIAVWVVSILLAAEFVFASWPKLSRAPQAVEGFDKAGYGETFLLFIGAAELLGGIGLLVPKLRFWAASGLSLIMIGAVFTHTRAGDTLDKMAPALISFVLLAWLAWTTRPARASA